MWKELASLLEESLESFTAPDVAGDEPSATYAFMMRLTHMQPSVEGALYLLVRRSSAVFTGTAAADWMMIDSRIMDADPQNKSHRQRADGATGEC